MDKDYDLLFTYDYSKSIAEYALTAKKIRKYTTFDYWFMFIQNDPPKEYAINPNTDTENKIFIEQKFMVYDFIDLLKTDSIGEYLLKQIDCVSDKISTLCRHPVELRRWQYKIFSNFNFNVQSRFIGKNYVVLEIRDPVCGFPLELAITDDDAVINVKIFMNIEIKPKDI